MLPHPELFGPTRLAFPRRSARDACGRDAARSGNGLVAWRCGRVAARTLRAAEDIVPFARSAMDGYALRSAETRFANAPLPAGADAVVPFEDVRMAHETIALSAPLGAGDCVFAPGDDAKSGDVLVAASEIITPGRVALLAPAGHAALAVYRRPRVAIVSTGNELVAIDERPRSGQVRNSNAAMLAACVERDGAQMDCFKR